MGVAELFLIMCGNLPIDKVGHCLLDFQLYICMDYNGLYMYGLEGTYETKMDFNRCGVLIGCSTERMQ